MSGREDRTLQKAMRACIGNLKARVASTTARGKCKELIMTTEAKTMETAEPTPTALSAVRRYCERCEPALYAVLRIVFGVVLLTHGLPKALGTSHGSMDDPMAGSIHLIQSVMGLPFAPQLAFLVMLLETGGALMLMLGLCTRAVALLVALEMVGISTALGPTWPWLDRGIEFPVLMGFLALYMAARGGSAYALDAHLWHVRSHG